MKAKEMFEALGDYNDSQQKAIECESILDEQMKSQVKSLSALIQ